jgi:hypothetical protein
LKYCSILPAFILPTASYGSHNWASLQVWTMSLTGFFAGHKLLLSLVSVKWIDSFNLFSSWPLQAEFYRLKKEYEKAELLYLEAIEILEESFGSDDIRYIKDFIYFLRHHAECQFIVDKQYLFRVVSVNFSGFRVSLHHCSQSLTTAVVLLDCKQ